MSRKAAGGARCGRRREARGGGGEGGGARRRRAPCRGSSVWIMRGRGAGEAARRRRRRTGETGDAGDGGEGGEAGDSCGVSEAREVGEGEREAGGGEGEARSQPRGVAGDCSVLSFRRLLYFRGPVCRHIIAYRI